jgi:hypothetical protein
MKRIMISTSIVAALLLGSATGVSADQHGGAAKARGNALVNAFNLAILGTTDADPWLLDDGCTGGTGEKDPGFFVAPISDGPVSTAQCVVHEDAPLVFVPAGVTCWQATLSAATDECEAAWSDPALVVVSSSVEIDGKPQRLTLYRTSTPSFTFPEGSILDVPGTTSAVFGINQAAIKHLDEGTHTARIRFLYADGFTSDRTFTIEVVD